MHTPTRRMNLPTWFIPGINKSVQKNNNTPISLSFPPPFPFFLSLSLKMVSAERVLEYIHLEKERDYLEPTLEPCTSGRSEKKTDATDAPFAVKVDHTSRPPVKSIQETSLSSISEDGQVAKGSTIEFRNLCIRYGQDSPYVLTDVNLVIQPGEKVSGIWMQALS